MPAAAPRTHAAHTMETVIKRFDSLGIIILKQGFEFLLMLSRLIFAHVMASGPLNEFFTNSRRKIVTQSHKTQHAQSTLALLTRLLITTGLYELSI